MSNLRLFIQSYSLGSWNDKKPFDSPREQSEDRRSRERHSAARQSSRIEKRSRTVFEHGSD